MPELTNALYDEAYWQSKRMAVAVAIASLTTSGEYPAKLREWIKGRFGDVWDTTDQLTVMRATRQARLDVVAAIKALGEPKEGG